MATRGKPRRHPAKEARQTAAANDAEKRSLAPMWDALLSETDEQRREVERVEAARKAEGRRRVPRERRK